MWWVSERPALRSSPRDQAAPRRRSRAWPRAGSASPRRVSSASLLRPETGRARRSRGSSGARVLRARRHPLVVAPQWTTPRRTDVKPRLLVTVLGGVLGVLLVLPGP